MLIGIDASRTAKQFKTGTETYSTELLKNYFGNITLQDLVEIQDKKKRKGRDKAKAKNH